MDADVAARFDQFASALAQQLEAMDQRAHERHQALLEVLGIRFDLVDRRFEAVDRRFEAVDRRFEAVDRRLETVERGLTDVDRRFDDAVVDRERRFKEERRVVAGQFEVMQKRMDERFDQLRVLLEGHLLQRRDRRVP